MIEVPVSWGLDQIEKERSQRELTAENTEQMRDCRSG